jgi:hypothetical protein
VKVSTVRNCPVVLPCSSTIEAERGPLETGRPWLQAKKPLIISTRSGITLPSSNMHSTCRVLEPLCK